MARLSAAAVAAAAGGVLLRGNPAAEFAAFGIDSRTLGSDGLFFAIPARRDGHDFVPAAAAGGASGAVVSREVGPTDPAFVLIKVEDTVAALQRLARSVLAASAVKVVGITGSVGKTTTKDFTAALLGGSFQVLKSEANLNNHLGLALSVLKLDPEHEVAVLEMGMSSPGEIRTLVGIAPPDTAVVTNIAPVHLEFLKTLEAVAEAKAEIIDGLKPGGTAVLNGDDAWGKILAKRASGRVISFGFGDEAEIRASELAFLGYDGLRFRVSYDGTSRIIRAPFLTEGLVQNLLAALGVARAFHLPWESFEGALAGLAPADNRGRILRLPGGIAVINDSYNSSPLALAMALKSYIHLPAARRVAVLGDMLELGDGEKSYHTEAGRTAAALGWDIVASVGPRGRWLAEGARAAGLSAAATPEFETSEDAAGIIPGLVRPNDLILVKGSRGVRMERIVERLAAAGKESF